MADDERIKLTEVLISLTTVSTSCKVECRPTLSRMAFLATSSGIPIASRIGDALEI